ncbi:MAG: methylated-DNA--[protein]-cysteine S-methyltransferase [Odoribacter sp.]
MKHFFPYQTSIGQLYIYEHNSHITAISFSEKPDEGKYKKQETPAIRQTFEQIDEYLLGKRKVFNVAIEPQGTLFQKKVWDVLKNIPYGETRSYKQIAEAVGNSKAYRAVGMANNRNPLPILVPCHRVIGTNGKLIGYAGGLNRKEQLLTLEKKHKNFD